MAGPTRQTSQNRTISPDEGNRALPSIPFRLPPGEWGPYTLIGNRTKLGRMTRRTRSARTLGTTYVLAWTLGGYEILAILAIALLLFGTRLPSLGRSLGSAIVQFKRAIQGHEDAGEGAEQGKEKEAETKR